VGLFSKIFGGGKSSGIVSGRNPGKGWIEANRFNRAKGGFAGGYGAITFGNIMHAHGDEDMIVSEHELDVEECPYNHPRFGCNCYTKAYQEEYRRAQSEARMMAAMGMDVDPEELMDMDQVEEDAYDYALELASMYIGGDTWIPIDILEWAYYEVSDHNG
jgi:hypothetical protein